MSQVAIDEARRDQRSPFAIRLTSPAAWGRRRPAQLRSCDGPPTIRARSAASYRSISQPKANWSPLKLSSGRMRATS